MAAGKRTSAPCSVKSTRIVPPTPSKRRAPRKPRIYPKLLRWRIVGGLDPWERDLLETHPKYRRELARGKLTDEMQAWLLLKELGYLEYVANRASQVGYDLSERITRSRWILRAVRHRTEEETLVLEELDSLQWRIDEERRFPPDELTDAEYGSLKASYPAVFRRLAQDLDAMLNSTAPTVVWSRAYRRSVPKRQRVSQEPIGERPAAEREAAAFRRELGEGFIRGAPAFRQEKIRDWRRMASKHTSEPNTFAHFEEE